MLDFKNWKTPIQPTYYKEFFQIGLITPLIHRDKQGRRIVIIRPRM